MIGAFATAGSARQAKSSRSITPTVWSRVRRNRSAAVGMVICGLLAVIAAIAPTLAPYNPLEADLLNALAPPSREHWLGTDDVGRDLLSRIMFGSRISLSVGVTVVVMAGTAGLLLGLASGYFEGPVDMATSWGVEVLLAFPSLLLTLAVVTVLGPSLLNAMFAVALAQVPSFIRITRGAVLGEKQREYVLAAHALGSGDFRLLRMHILPNVLAPVIVLASLSVGTAILVAASLSFLGLGAQPPAPEWGSILAQGRAHIRRAWWVTTFPGLAIAITVLGVNLLGDGVRDVLDPRLRR